MHNVFGVGYQSLNLEDLAARREELGALIVDVRLKPWSNRHEWRRPHLAARFRESYVHVESLGNINYKNGGPVLLKDERAGIADVMSMTASCPVILLCACWDGEKCHRKNIMSKLTEYGLACEELQKAKQPPEAPKKIEKPPPAPDPQGRLF